MAGSDGSALAVTLQQQARHARRALARTYTFQSQRAYTQTGESTRWHVVSVAYSIKGTHKLSLCTEHCVRPRLFWLGTTVGIVSVLGYTPDVFFAALAGRLLDAAPGLPGFQHLLTLMAGIGVLGLLVAIVLYRSSRAATRA